MRVNDLDAIFKTLFGRHLHVELKLASGKTLLTPEFLKVFNQKWAFKTIPILSLIDTMVDTNEWQFDHDLCVRLYSIKLFDQRTSEFENVPILCGDFENKIEHFPITRIYQLTRYAPESEQEAMASYIADMKEYGHYARY